MVLNCWNGKKVWIGLENTGFLRPKKVEKFSIFFYKLTLFSLFNFCVIYVMFNFLQRFVLCYWLRVRLHENFQTSLKFKVNWVQFGVYSNPIVILYVFTWEKVNWSSSWCEFSSLFQNSLKSQTGVTFSCKQNFFRSGQTECTWRQENCMLGLCFIWISFVHVHKCMGINALAPTQPVWNHHINALQIWNHAKAKKVSIHGQKMFLKKVYVLIKLWGSRFHYVLFVWQISCDHLKFNASLSHQ